MTDIKETGREAARAKPVALPASDCDLLTGIEQIARWFGISAGQCNSRIRDGSIAVFKLPDRSTLYALKSENMRLWRAAAEAHRDRSNSLT